MALVFTLAAGTALWEIPEKGWGILLQSFTKVWEVCEYPLPAQQLRVAFAFDLPVCTGSPVTETGRSPSATRWGCEPEQSRN